MYFENFDAVVHMAGHGKFVWSAYAITVLTLLGLIVVPYRRTKQAKQSIRMRMRREEVSS